MHRAGCVIFAFEEAAPLAGGPSAQESQLAEEGG